MKKLYILSALIPCWFLGQIPSGYYDGTQGLSGYPLKSKIHEIILKNHNWYYGDLPAFYGTTDLDKYYENDNSILDIYSEKPNSADAYSYTVGNMVGSASAEGQGYNREHMMPQSTFSSDYPMYSDLFFVVPTDARINQLRSNYPYGESTTVPSNIYYNFTNGSKIGKNADTSYYTGRVYEPIDEFKGDVARSMLYFAVRYEGKLGTFNYFPGSTNSNDTNPLNGTEERAFDSWFLNLMLQWHSQDPVSQREIDRNNLVYAIQKNRNPFIDHPEWVNMIWNQSPVLSTPPSPQNLSVSQISSHFVKLEWTDTSTETIGYKIFVNGQYHGYTHNKSYFADHLLPSTHYTISVKAYNNSYLESSEATTSTTTNATSSYAKDLLITKYIEGTTSSTNNIYNNALEISNLTGHEVNLEQYKLNIQNYNSTTGTYYYSNSFQLEGKVAPGETFVILNPYSHLSCYTIDQAKFVTASSPLTYTGSQYLELSFKGNPVDVIGTKNTYNTNNNVSLYRKPSILQPTENFNLSEWISHPMNYCNDLGSLGNQEVQYNTDLQIDPNPVTDQTIGVKGTAIEKIQKAIIFDARLSVIKEIQQPFKNKNTIEVGELIPGVYWLYLDGKALQFIKK